ncbi:heme oxygenase [Pseudomonas aeruginosa]|nr:heme oxygenase [Pseudomonas aeruginosa]
MDTLAPESTRQNLRSQRLNLLTNEPHQRLESLVKSKEPFASRDNFARFVAAQYLFQHDLEPLYRNEALARLFPGLASRARDDAARADLADLGHPVPEGDQSVREADLSLAEALGWLFVFRRFEAGRCVPVQEGRRARTRRELRRPPSGRTGRRPRARLEELRGDPRRHRAERGRRAPGRQGRQRCLQSFRRPAGAYLRLRGVPCRQPTSPTTIAPAWLPGFSVLRRRPGARTCGDP